MRHRNFIIAILFCLSTLIFSGCSDKTLSSLKATESGSYNRNDLYPLLTEGGQSVMFNMTLSYKDISLNGFLLATMEDEETIHCVCTAFMGMKLFDFTIQEHGFKVNSCMEQLDRKIILRLLKKDLVTLFTRNVHSTFKAKKYREPAKTKLGYRIRTATGKASYLIDNSLKRPSHVSVSGGPLKAEFTYTDESITISHPRLGLEMVLYR